MNEQIFAQQALFQKYRNTKSSGYLDDEYELSRDFRQVQDYHFRIEDDQEIIELQSLQKKSVPLHTGFAVSTPASMEFNRKMDNLLSSLDHAAIRKEQSRILPQTHGFYKINDDAYDEKKSLEAAYEHLQLNSLNKRMQNLTIDNTKIKFKPKPANRNRQLKDMLMRQQKQEKQEQAKKQIVNKMKKMSLHDAQL